MPIRAIDQTYGPVIGAIALLLRACEEAGVVRPGLDPDDVLVLIGCLWRAGSGEAGDRQAGRLLDLVMDSLHAGAPGPAAGINR